MEENKNFNSKLSVVVPIFNEQKFLRQVVSRIEAADLGQTEKEIILVDDGSTDGTKEILRELENTGKYKIIYHQKNSGKGAALRTGFASATGDYVIIQDADLEYNPQEYSRLIQPLLRGEADIVYGSRMSGKNKIGYWAYYLGNYIISLITRILYKAKLTDIETCYKIFKKEILEKIKFNSNSFDFEAEFTAKVLKNKYRILEMPISYNPRKFSDGKKIGWRDGVQAIWTLIKIRFMK